MLINHRKSAYIDVDEIERGAGLLEILYKDTGVPEYQGASFILRIFSNSDVDLKSAEDLVVLVKRLIESEVK